MDYYAKLSVHNISIHAPREGGDRSGPGRIGPVRKFQSTPPARGATLPAKPVVVKCAISIHAPREGGDFHIK